MLDVMFRHEATIPVSNCKAALERRGKQPHPEDTRDDKVNLISIFQIKLKPTAAEIYKIKGRGDMRRENRFQNDKLLGQTS